MKHSIYTSYDELPLMLSVAEVAAVLGISRAGAYELVHGNEFPALKIGSRIVVPKDMISYDNLWNVMKEKGVSQYALIKKHNISPAQITRLKRNESVSTHTIEMFCKILDCQVGDIMEYIKDDEE